MPICILVLTKGTTMQVINIRVKQVQVELTALLAKLEQLRKDYANLYNPNGYTDTKAMARKAKAINKIYIAGETLNTEYKQLTGDMYDHRFYMPKLYKVG